MGATPSTRLEPAARETLLQIAIAAIETGLARGGGGEPDTAGRVPGLLEKRASFVTITIDGALRGCCGTLEATRPLLVDVWHNARASAFRDPRFAPLTAGEWRRSQLELSVLSPCERVIVTDEQELLLALVPGRDGLVLAWRGTRATFLPKVWAQVAGPRDFLRRLKQKAGWPADFWATDLEIWRYETEIIPAARPVNGGTAPG